MMRRAVIYARCSTEEESQKDALIKQIAEAKDCVQNKGWLLVDSYVESRSGTTTKGRTEYNRLYDDLLQDKFDIIVIKSQDRLMRNTKDWYLFVDRLTTSNKKLYIYLENKFYTTDDALITGIKAILAEDYSRELSKKLNNMHRNRQKNNGAPILSPHTYGLKQLPDKSFVVIEEEANLKRKMYELCAAGYGSRTIATILKNEGYVNRNGKDFTADHVLRIIRNPLNKGTIVMNRRHFDFDSKRTFRNPEEEYYVYEHKVPAIVSEQLWEAANKKIDERAKRVSTCDHSIKKGFNPGKDMLSGKIVCGLCGEPFYRKTYVKSKDQCRVYQWSCSRYLEKGRIDTKKSRKSVRKVELRDKEGCDNVHIHESVLYPFLQHIVSERYMTDKEKIIHNMMGMIKQILEEKNHLTDIETEKKKKEQIQKQMDILVDKLLEGILADEIYQKKQKELVRKHEATNEKIKSLEMTSVKDNIMKERISSIENSLRSAKMVEKATVAEMLRDVEKIYIYPTYMEIRFSLRGMLGIETKEFEEELDNVIRIEYGNLFNYSKQKEDEREIIVKMMKNNPFITARKIAGKLGISLSGANYRIRALKREGKIRYDGRGGCGKWVVLEDKKSE